MKARFINTQEAETGVQKYYAALNAQTRNTNNKSKYSAAAQLQADRVANMLEILYSAKVYTNYRARFIALKVASTKRSTKQLREYEQYLAEQNWEKKQSAQGTIYTISAANLR